MAFQESRFRRESFGQRNPLSFKAEEVFTEAFLGAVIPEGAAEEQAEVFVNSNQVGIESCVLGRGETETIMRIEAICAVFPPGGDVASAQERGNWDSRDTAASVVGGENHSAKELLSPAGRNLGPKVGRWRLDNHAGLPFVSVIDAQ